MVQLDCMKDAADVAKQLESDLASRFGCRCGQWSRV